MVNHPDYDYEKFTKKIYGMLKGFQQRLEFIEDRAHALVNLEKNNLDRVEADLLLASRIFGERVTLEQCLNEIRKLKDMYIKDMFNNIKADIYLMVDGDDTYPANRAKEMIRLIKRKNIDNLIR